MALPPVPHPLVEAFGRPTWRERRRRAEAAELAAARLPPPGGRPQSVVVVPGFFGTEASVGELVGWLRRGGHRVLVAELDRNFRASSWAVDRITEALAEADGPSVLIGHSRGGQQCRVATLRHPDLVTQLITLGAPVRAHPPKHFLLRAAVESLRVAGTLGVLGGHDRAEDRRYEATLQAPFTADVPWTAVHSRSDGFVAWQACFDPAATNVEIDTSHRGLIESVPAFRAIAATMSESPVVREHGETVRTGESCPKTQS